MKSDSKAKRDKKWKSLILKYEARKISCARFCKKYKVSKGGIYKWRKYFLSQESSSNDSSEFIPIEIKQKEPALAKSILNIASPIRISNGSGLTIEFISGCTLAEFAAIMERVNVTQ
jgi:hypothetical protein